MRSCTADDLYVYEFALLDQTAAAYRSQDPGRQDEPTSAQGYKALHIDPPDKTPSNTAAG